MEVCRVFPSGNKYVQEGTIDFPFKWSAAGFKLLPGLDLDHDEQLAYNKGCASI
jgi:hypothetical protein